jgi:hypothetical protein
MHVVSVTVQAMEPISTPMLCLALINYYLQMLVYSTVNYFQVHQTNLDYLMRVRVID